MHLSAFAYRGASLTIIEATAVQPEGRITPECPGLWKDSQIAPIRQIADFVHSQGQLLGIQLAHAGRKASTVAPWLAEKATGKRGVAITATEDVGGWPGHVKGMSAIRWGEGYVLPKEMSVQEIRDVIAAFADSAKRAVEAGVDTIELHAAHGYLLCSSLSPISNKRTDSYGGSFENRCRMLIETIQAVRAVIPKDMPLLLRISSTEWMDGIQPPHPDATDGTWTVDDSIRLARLLPGLGVDLLDCSSGGNHPEQKIAMHNGFQVGIAGQIRQALLTDDITDLMIGCVGMITEAEPAKAAVQDGMITSSQPSGNETQAGAQNGMVDSKITPSDSTIEVQDEQGATAKADIVLIARQFLREPEWVLRVAYRLGVDVKWPQQYHRGTFLRGSRI